MAAPATASSTEQKGVTETSKKSTVEETSRTNRDVETRADEAQAHQGESPAGQPLGEVHGQGGSPHARSGKDEPVDPNPSEPRTGLRTEPVEDKGFTAS